MEIAIINLGENSTTVSPGTTRGLLAPVLLPRPRAKCASASTSAGNDWVAAFQEGGSFKPIWSGFDVWTGEAVDMEGELTLRPHASVLMQFTKSE